MNNLTGPPVNIIWVFRTNLQRRRDVEIIRLLLDQHQAIRKWNVCLDDCDKILRIESDETLTALTVCSMLDKAGFECEELE